MATTHISPQPPPLQPVPSLLPVRSPEQPGSFPGPIALQLTPFLWTKPLEVRSWSKLSPSAPTVASGSSLPASRPMHLLFPQWGMPPCCPSCTCQHPHHPREPQLESLPGAAAPDSTPHPCLARCLPAVYLRRHPEITAVPQMRGLDSKMLQATDESSSSGAPTSPQGCPLPATVGAGVGWEASRAGKLRLGHGLVWLRPGVWGLGLMALFGILPLPLANSPIHFHFFLFPSSEPGSGNTHFHCGGQSETGERDPGEPVCM